MSKRKPLELEPAIRDLRISADIANHLACDHLDVSQHSEKRYGDQAMFAIMTTLRLARELEAAFNAGDFKEGRT